MRPHPHDELAKMRKAGRVVAEMHETTRAAVRPGVTTLELDRVAREVLERRGAPGRTSSATTGVPGGDLRVAQRHDRARHPGRARRARGGRHHLDRLRGDHRGLPRRRRLHDGRRRDLRRGGPADRGHRAQSLCAGIDQMVDGNRLTDIGHAVQDVAEAAGFSVVREYVGHAIGTAMHEEPQVPNYGRGGTGPKLRSGIVFAVEPMVNAGTADDHAARRRLERRHRRRLAVGPLRAHHRHHRRRPGGLHRCL